SGGCMGVGSLAGVMHGGATLRHIVVDSSTVVVGAQNIDTGGLIGSIVYDSSQSIAAEYITRLTDDYDVSVHDIQMQATVGTGTASGGRGIGGIIGGIRYHSEDAVDGKTEIDN